MNQSDANRVAQLIANYGASLGLSRPTCMVQNAARKWSLLATCIDPLTGQQISQSIDVQAEANEEIFIRHAGSLLMQTLDATFHTKH